MDSERSSAISNMGAFDRRKFLKGMAIGGAGIALPSLLSACGSGASATSALSTSTAKPTRGGQLRIAMVGEGTSETLNPQFALTYVDYLRAYALFDPLVRVAPDYKTEPGLAVSWEHNSDATVWQIKLRQGVTWHDGKPLTADDLIYTLRAMGDPSNFGHSSVVNINLRDLKKVDTTTVQVPLTRPIAHLQDFFLFVNPAMVIQDGTKDFKAPIGTGPYKFQSFTPGQRSVFVANHDYWDHPKPYPDALEVLSISDDTARLNALAGGEIDICGTMSYVQAKAGGNGQWNLLTGYGGNNMVFYMAVDQAPFTDKRVRQAVRLLADRPALIDSALAGFGTPANDIFGKGLPFYNDTLPQRVQDVEQAKSLLKQAGASNLNVTLQTSPIYNGAVESATVLAQQLGQGGVNAQIQRRLPGPYFDPTLLYGKMSFGQDLWSVGSIGVQMAQSLFPGGGFDTTHWNDPTFEANFYKALGETDETKATQMWYQLQEQQFNEGGYIVWCNAHGVSGLSPKVQNCGDPKSGWFYNLDDLRVWNWSLAS